jgi:hypothetical protein
MRRNSRITGRRICAVVALAMVIAWGIPALAPAASADSAVASAATRSAPPRVHPSVADVPDDYSACIYVLTQAKYTITATMVAGCTAGSTSYPSSASDSIALALCAGFLTLATVHPVIMIAACLAANLAAILVSTQYCGPSYSDCVNAWGGGPWVDEYTGGPELSDTHQDFTVIDENGSQSDSSEIMFYGSGSWNGECIGDAYNNSGYADTSLDPCALPGQSAGWGTQMTWGTSGCPSGEAWFHDNHWNGYLAPANGGVNGSHWYLNDQTKTCLYLVLLEQ